jgi:hypothetical protein
LQTRRVVGDKAMSAGLEIEQIMRDLEAAGLIKRWYCDVCEDFVPYKCFEMSEDKSRKGHARENKTHKELANA